MPRCGTHPRACVENNWHRRPQVGFLQRLLETPLIHWCQIKLKRPQRVRCLAHLADSGREAAVVPELEPQAGEVDNMSSQLPGDVVIRLERIHKTYKLGDIDVHALRGVSLEIRRGEFVAIMGPS